MKIYLILLLHLGTTMGLIPTENFLKAVAFKKAWKSCIGKRAAKTMSKDIKSAVDKCRNERSGSFSFELDGDTLFPKDDSSTEDDFFVRRKNKRRNKNRSKNNFRHDNRARSNDGYDSYFRSDSHEKDIFDRRRNDGYFNRHDSNNYRGNANNFGNSGYNLDNNGFRFNYNRRGNNKVVPKSGITSVTNTIAVPKKNAVEITKGEIKRVITSKRPDELKPVFFTFIEDPVANSPKQNRQYRQKRDPRYSYYNSDRYDDDDDDDDDEDDDDDDDDDDSEEDEEIFSGYSVQDLIDGEERLQFHLSNFSCVLQELDLIDDDGDLRTRKILDTIDDLDVDRELKNDLEKGVKDCNELSKCLPDDDGDDDLIPIELKRAYGFLKCVQVRRQTACFKHDLRTYLEDEIPSDIRRSLNMERSIKRIFYIKMSDLFDKKFSYFY